jgi:hypothetical protein
MIVEGTTGGMNVTAIGTVFGIEKCLKVPKSSLLWG